MALRAIILDGENIPHMMIGLSRSDVESIQRGEVYVLSGGEDFPLSLLTKKSDIIVIFEETDNELVARMKAGVARSAEPAATKKRVAHKHIKARK